jgi:hypothetical protein
LAESTKIDDTSNPAPMAVTTPECPDTAIDPPTSTSPILVIGTPNHLIQG